MLVGIAKLAADSPRLEAKRRVEYFDLPARSIVNRVENMGNKSLDSHTVAMIILVHGNS